MLVRLCRCHARPKLYRVVTVSHTQNQATVRSANRTAWRRSSRGNYFLLLQLLSLSLAHSWHKHAGREHNRHVQNTRGWHPRHRQVAVSAVQIVAYAIRMEGKWHGNGERRSKHCVTSLLLTLSVSLSFLSLSLSLSLSLPQDVDLNSVRIAPHKSSSTLGP